MSRKRTFEIAVRTAHIGAMALLVGGHHFGAASASLHAWYVLTALTGAALLAAEASHSRHWVYQARGVVSLVHVGAFAILALAPGNAGIALAVALIVGSVGSHLPGRVRKWSLRHRRVLDG